MGDTEMAGGVFATTPSSPKAPAPVHNSRRSPGSSLSEWFMKYAVAICAVILAGLFAMINTSTFLTVPNLQLVLGSNSVALILAIGELTPLIAGEFDLSIGYTLELSMVVTAVLSEHGLGPLETLVIAVVMGLLIGVVNSALITGLGVSSFIATLGVGTVLSALSLELTNGAILIQGIPQSLISFAAGQYSGHTEHPLARAGLFRGVLAGLRTQRLRTSLTGRRTVAARQPVGRRSYPRHSGHLVLAFGKPFRRGRLAGARKGWICKFWSGPVLLAASICRLLLGCDDNQARTVQRGWDSDRSGTGRDRH